MVFVSLQYSLQDSKRCFRNQSVQPISSIVAISITLFSTKKYQHALFSKTVVGDEHLAFTPATCPPTHNYSVMFSSSKWIHTGNLLNAVLKER